MELKLDCVNDRQDWVDDGDLALRVCGSFIGGVRVKFIVGVAECGYISQMGKTSIFSYLP